MAISLKHSFTNPKADGADATVVRPSNWNAEHVLTMASGFLLGRTTAGAGEVEELSADTVNQLLAGLQTIWVPAGAMTATETNGAASGSVETATNDVMLVTMDFDAATEEYAQFSVRMPKSWDRGTVTGMFVWSHPATATNFTLIWNLQGLALSDDDAADVAFGTRQQIADTGGTTDDIYHSAETPAVTIGGTPAEGDLVIFQVSRDAADGGDTLAVDGRLHGVLVVYGTDQATDD